MHTIYIYCIMMDKVILSGKKQKVLVKTIKIRKILFLKYTCILHRSHTGISTVTLQHQYPANQMTEPSISNNLVQWKQSHWNTMLLQDELPSFWKINV